MNEADRSACGYDRLVELFYPRLSWGHDFVRNEDGLGDLETQMQESASVSHGEKLGKLERAVELHAAAVDAKLAAMHADISRMREETKHNNYLQLASAAQKCKNPAPFASLEDAESFLSASSVAMDGLKALFSQQHFVIQTRAKNEQRLAAGKPSTLPSALIFDFLFTPEVKKELADYEKFR